MIGIGPKAKYTDETVNRFKKTNLLYTTDPYMLYQDPTYLGFKLFFTFDQPDSGLLSRYNHTNTAMGYLDGIGDSYRMNYLHKFVDILQNVNLKTPWFFQTIEGLDQAWKRGYQEQDFKAALPKDRKISIGCEESVDLRMTAMMDFYRKACFDWNMRREVVPWNLRVFDVYIYVYEARTINKSGQPSPSGLLDLSKLLGLSDINKKQQEENQRLLGKVDSSTGNAGALNKARESISAAFGGKSAIDGIKSALNPKPAEGVDSPDTEITRILYKFKQCEWLPDESSEIFTKVGNTIGERAMQKIAFSYRDVEEINLYTIYSRDVYVQDVIIGQMDIAANDVPFKEASQDTPGGWSLDSVLNDKVGKLAAPFAALGMPQIEKLISSYAGKLLMGNIYGFSAGAALGQLGGVLSGDPTAMVAGAAGLANQLIPSASKKNRSHNIPGNEPYFDRITPNGSNDVGTIGKIYNPPINRTKDAVDKIGNSYSESTSFANRTNDVANIDGNPYPDSKSLSNLSKDSTGSIPDNPYPGSNSLTNPTKDSTDISGNPYPGSNSLNFATTDSTDISGNPYPDSESLSNKTVDKSNGENIYE